MSSQDSQPDMKLFWGCFIALITTAFAFITRAFLVGDPSFGQLHLAWTKSKARSSLVRNMAIRDQYYCF